MTSRRWTIACLGALLALPLLAQAPLRGLWEGKLANQPVTITFDFDSLLVSVNGSTPVPMTVTPAGDPAAVQVTFSFAGRAATFAGKQDGMAITGTLAGGPFSLARLPDSAPRLVARKRYPLPSGSRDDASIAKARALIDELVRKQEIPGLSVAVARNGKVLWSEGFGMADVELGVPVTPLTRFRLGSVSKVLTAAAVGRLVEEGKLDLDVPIQRYVPDFPAKPWPITTRQLAAHTSGIRHYGDSDFAGPLKGAPHFASIAEGLSLFKNDPLLFEPGTAYSYSSYGWNLISRIIEAASGQEFLSYMRNNIFDPLGLRSITADHVDAIIPNRARFYQREAPGRPLEHYPYVDNSYKWASGGFLATSEDLVRFGSAHLSPGFFKPATLQLLFKGVSVIPGNPIEVGVGWRIGRDTAGRRIFHHAGTSEGGRAVLLMYPDSGVVIALLSNILAGFGERDAELIASLFITAQ